MQSLRINSSLVHSLLSTHVGSVAVKIMRDLGFNGVIIGLSGDHEESEFIRCGVDKVLLKPINRIVLEEALYLKR